MISATTISPIGPMSPIRPITTAQPELALADPNPLTDADQDHLATLIGLLAARKDWTPAYDLLIWLDVQPTESRRRWLRNLAANSDGLIISGQHGYRHISHATPDEVAHAANWLEHQATTMGQRARAIRRCFHHSLSQRSNH